jgi:hypothetical protein
MATGIDIGGSQRDAIGEENRIELGSFRRTGKIHEIGEGLTVRGVGVAPGRDMVAGEHQESAER